MDRHAKALKLLRQGCVIPAIPLALTDSGAYDAAAQRRLVRYYMTAGAGGIAAAIAAGLLSSLIFKAKDKS